MRLREHWNGQKLASKKRNSITKLWKQICVVSFDDDSTRRYNEPKEYLAMPYTRIRSALLLSIAAALLAASFVVVPEKTRASPSTQADQRIKFDTDQKEGVVRVIIDGKEIARMDATGFYVHGDIAYTGTITDGLPLRVSTDGGNAK